MPAIDPRVDAYIDKSAEFARPILRHLRALVHEACPDVQETIKWSFAAFEYHGLLCSMAAFKAHATFGFWKEKLLLGDSANAEAMGSFGRLTTIADLPDRATLIALIHKAMQLNVDGVKPPGRGADRKPRPELETPPDLAELLASKPGAKERFAAFPPSHRREYIEWIAEARRDETRRRRLAQAVEWIAEGKSRNWKYENC